MDPAERDAQIRYLSEPDPAGRGVPTTRALAARVVDAEELAKKLELQLDGWAALLGVNEEYWLPADSKETHRDDMRRFFFALSDFGRKNALKGSRFNTEALSLRRSIEHECDTHRTEKHGFMKALEDKTVELDALRKLIDRTEEELRQAKGALAQAEDFIVTHAAQGDEKLLAVVGAVLDKDLLPKKAN